TIPFRYKFKDRFLWGVKCDQCELISIWPRPSDKEIEEMYAEDYFTGTDKQTHHMEVDYMQILSQGDYKAGVQELRKYGEHASVLDVGCATGNFLYALKNAGYTVAGTELSAFAAAYGNKNFQVNIVNKPFNKQLMGNGFSSEQFNIILMGDVLEHFTNPTEATETAFALLKPHGVLLIQLPGTLNLISSKLAFILYKLTGSQKTMYIPPYHLTEFTAKTATKMLQQAGFSKVNIKQDIKPPSTITLRGNAAENFVKKSLQYINYVLTKWFGIAGDRIIIEAFK
ncbi:MAG: class I SAM-dependent methyltransferase, partial [Bacteroidota bacterium]